MRTTNAGWVLVAAFAVAQSPGAQGQWPTKSWPSVPPRAVGLDPKALAGLYADSAAGTYGYIDSLLVIRRTIEPSRSNRPLQLFQSLVPEKDVIFVVTGWNILPDTPGLAPRVAIDRILQTVTDERD